MVSAVEIGTLLKPIIPPATLALAAATAVKGAKKPPAKAPKPPRKTVRRLSGDTSWMDGLEERLLSSMREKSFAMSIFQKVKKGMPRRHGGLFCSLAVRQIHDACGVQTGHGLFRKSTSCEINFFRAPTNNRWPVKGASANGQTDVEEPRFVSRGRRDSARKALKRQPHGQSTFSALAKDFGGIRPAMRGICRLGLGNGGRYLGIVLVPRLN